jgi:class 3 adenylate cyclase
VSVLFADLVGFTTLSEHRDAEEVRELLSAYFDRSRSVIARYGGTVEKFIGDAVMAVWGTPVAREDDPERAVRAALALTQAVGALGDEVGMPELQVRAGVLTGSAAVDLGAEGEGMVLGDTVNTASRLQSLAAAGKVLVDDVTRRASEAAIAYEDAGTHSVKGREQPVHAWTALRVVAGAGGARRSAGVEAPFVGRDRELQAIIDGGERSARGHRAEHVAIVGDAGSGKSRLLWEFFKYLDGIEEVRWWHQGRCLSYGEGVGYWALAEMVRARAGISEEEPPALAREKLAATVAEHVPLERDRRLVEPRLAHLLRLEERPDADRADLFSGWRLFFERMAQTNPVILAFEDLQWADSGLLDFIDYLLEWSPDVPIFVLTFARPELLERRPAWAPMILAPLEGQAVAAILDGLAPGLPTDLVAEIVARAEGIPLYAVETIRMLQDRGLLVQSGSRYLVEGDISDLEVPESLHALVASRLDGLSPGERGLLQDASVLGQAFTAAAAAAVSDRPEPEVGATLDGLVAKQVLGRDDDPRSPDRGQYVFLQALLRTVAYGTLTRRARKSRHIAAARYLEQTWPGEAADIAEVLASHYQEAIRAEPDADDVPALRASARDRLAGAGRAAASLALGPEASRYFEQAAELAEEDLERAELLEQAGNALWQSGDLEAAEQRLRQSMALFESCGRRSGGSAAVTLATMFSLAGRVAESEPLLRRFRDPDPSTDPIVRARALAVLGNRVAFEDESGEAGQLFDEALEMLELQRAMPVLAEALVRRATYLAVNYRREEGIAVLRHALGLAEEQHQSSVALRARYTLAGISLDADRLADALNEATDGLALARERGDRPWERAMMGQAIPALAVMGRWDEALPLALSLTSRTDDSQAVFGAVYLAMIAAARGDEETLERCGVLAADHEDAPVADERAAATLIAARLALERGALTDAMDRARSVLGRKGVAGEIIVGAYYLAIEAANLLRHLETIGELKAFVDGLPPARATPLLRAGRAQLAAGLAHRQGDLETMDRLDSEAARLLLSVGARPFLAAALADHARRCEAPEALAEARSIYEELRAVRWLDRLDQATGRRREVVEHA